MSHEALELLPGLQIPQPDSIVSRSQCPASESGEGHAADRLRMSFQTRIPLPVATSQSRAVPSLLPVSANRPSSDSATEVISPEWPNSAYNVGSAPTKGGTQVQKLTKNNPKRAQNGLITFSTPVTCLKCPKAESHSHRASCARASGNSAVLQQRLAARLLSQATQVLIRSPHSCGASDMSRASFPFLEKSKRTGCW